MINKILFLLLTIIILSGCTYKIIENKTTDVVNTKCADAKTYCESLLTKDSEGRVQVNYKIMEIVFLTFAITITAEILLSVSLITTLFSSKYSMWPIAEKNSWRCWVIWILMVVAIVGFIATSILDYNTFFITHWMRYPIGAALILFGAFIGVWAVKTISIHSTFGLKGKLVTNGPYKYSRNPQHMGDIIIIMGVLVFSNSFLTVITGFFGFLWLILAPFTEERWCQKYFDKQYKEYCKKVPRFV